MWVFMNFRRTLDINRREVQAALNNRHDRAGPSFGARDRPMEYDRRNFYDRERDTRRDRMRRDDFRGFPKV